MPSPTACALLVPDNLQARLAFDAVCRSFLVGQQSANSLHVYVYPQQVYNHEVALERFQQALGSQQSTTEDSSSDTTSESEGDTEREPQEPGDLGDLGLVWSGGWELDLSKHPHEPNRGWKIGSNANQAKVDIQLTTKERNDNVKSYHARLNLHTNTRFIYIVSRASQNSPGRVTINGETVDYGKQYTFNRDALNLWVGALKFKVLYTEYSRSSDFMTERLYYVDRYLGFKASGALYNITPTPDENSRGIGPWTIGKTCGKGGGGRVHSASNTKNELAAIKLVTRTSNESEEQVAAEIEILKTLTALAKKGSAGRVVRLREVIYPHGNKTFVPPFDEVALVLVPVVHSTLEDQVRSAWERRTNKSKVLFLQDMIVYRSFLSALSWLHVEGYIHGDVKPSNIGVIENEAWLLDNGGSQHTSNGGAIFPTPGQPGTVPYLAPERQLSPYGFGVDVWAAGITLFQLVFGRWPFYFDKNPWRPGENLEDRTADFHSKYRLAMDGIRRSKQIGGLMAELCDLLPKMLRFYAAQTESQRKDRISVKEALDHPCWLALEEEMKKRRDSRDDDYFDFGEFDLDSLFEYDLFEDMEFPDEDTPTGASRKKTKRLGAMNPDTVLPKVSFPAAEEGWGADFDKVLAGELSKTSISKIPGDEEAPTLRRHRGGPPISEAVLNTTDHLP